MSRSELLSRATDTALDAGPLSGRVLRAVIYARVSSDPNNRGKSVTDQVAECTRECEQRGWRVVAIFEDNDRSASRYATKERKNYARLIEFLRAGKADVLVTWEASRAQRDLEAYLRLRELAEQNGVQWCYKGRLYDLSRTDDRFTTGLDALLAERESSEIRDRVLRGKRSSAEQGRPNGRMLYGYGREYDPRTGEFMRSVVREDQAAIVREAVRRFAAGEALSALCRDFNRRGLRTNTGNYWWPYTMRAMLTNPGYLGKRVRRGVIIADAEWPALLTGKDKEAFHACVQRLTDPERTTTRPGAVRHLLSGIARCGVCGGRLAATYREKRAGDTERPMRYACQGTPVHHGGCTAVAKTAFDRFITGLVMERLSRPDAADLVADNGQQSEQAAAMLAEAAEKRATLDETADEVAAGRMSASMAARIEARLLPEIAALEQRGQTASVAPVLRGLIGHDVAAVWPTLPVTQQREVIRALMDVTLTRSAVGTADTARRQQMREELGLRLRQLRRGCGLRGMGERQLARLAGWKDHKVNNAERGRGTLTAEEVRLWCRLVGAESEANALVTLIPFTRVPLTDRFQVTWKHDL